LLSLTLHAKIISVMPKRTYQPSKKKRQRTHGFRSKAAVVLKRRRRKGRKKLSA